jgi:hypothetical protein
MQAAARRVLCGRLSLSRVGGSCAAYRGGALAKPSSMAMTGQVSQSCGYHTSAPLLAPKGKKGGKASKGGDDDTPAAAPDMKPLDAKMEDKVFRLGDEFLRIRAGRASADIFKDIRVDAFGSKVPLEEAGQIAFATPTKMTVTAFDIALAVPGNYYFDIYYLYIYPYIVFFI